MVTVAVGAIVLVALLVVALLSGMNEASICRLRREVAAARKAMEGAEAELREREERMRIAAETLDMSQDY